MQYPPPADAPLSDWLRWLESGRRGDIVLGLDRVRAVADRLALPHIPTITVAGTNGKGTCAHFAHRLARAAGVRAALYTSPHLCDFTERIVIHDGPAPHADIASALAAVEAARGDVSLTYFEHTTLAALWLFAQQRVELQVLEVGLGGRLDAVNIIDADVAVVTSIGFDHARELGDTLEAIAREKAGITRAGRPAIVATPEPPQCLLDALDATGAQIQVIPVPCEDGAGRWSIPGVAEGLPAPRMDGNAVRCNIAAAVMAVASVAPARSPDEAEGVIRGGGSPGQALFPDSASLHPGYRVGKAVGEVIEDFRLPGRQQWHDGVLFDIAHNAEAARELAGVLDVDSRWHIVLGMLSDKPVEKVLAALAPRVHALYCAAPDTPRALPADALHGLAEAAGLPVAGHYASVRTALDAARQQAAPGHRILVTGSFYTVSEALCAPDAGR